MLKDKRTEKGLSQSKLAEKSGVNVRAIQFYEQGIRDINGAKLETLIALAMALECRISDILNNDSRLKELCNKVNL